MPGFYPDRIVSIAKLKATFLAESDERKYDCSNRVDTVNAALSSSQFPSPQSTLQHEKHIPSSYFKTSSNELFARRNSSAGM